MDIANTESLSPEHSPSFLVSCSTSSRVICRSTATDAYYYVGACCCPCYLLGQMRSMTRREPPLWANLSNIGFYGISTCFQTGLLSLLAWPISPGLGLYLYMRRQRLNILYEEVKFSSFSVIDCLHISITWPAELRKQQAYLDAKMIAGNLRFDWEEESRVIRDSLKPPPPSVEKRIVLIGSDGSGKSTLFRKFLMLCEESTPGAYVHDTKLKVGIKSISISENQMQFIEVWDLPTSEVSTQSGKAAIAQADAIIFLFDCTDSSGESLKYIQRVHSDMIAQQLLQHSPLLIVAASKTDLILRPGSSSGTSGTRKHRHKQDSSSSAHVTAGTVDAAGVAVGAAGDVLVDLLARADDWALSLSLALPAARDCASPVHRMSLVLDNITISNLKRHIFLSLGIS